jgi:hypothetical protein
MLKLVGERMLLGLEDKLLLDVTEAQLVQEVSCLLHVVIEIVRGRVVVIKEAIIKELIVTEGTGELFDVF